MKKAMAKYVFLLVIGILIFTCFDCRKNPVGPPPGSDATSSAFTWTGNATIQAL
jgi:hypothetical protein